MLTTLSACPEGGYGRPMTVLRVALASAVLLAVPAGAHAGTLTNEAPASLTYTAVGGEQVGVGTEGISAFVATQAPSAITYGAGTGTCFFHSPQRGDCPMVARFIVKLGGSGGEVDGSEVAGPPCSRRTGAPATIASTAPSMATSSPGTR